jgi:uncharacterized protein YvpB
LTLGAENINQYANGAPNGCEAAASLEALHLLGYAKNYNYAAFLKTMPIATNGNPNNGFGGSPYNNSWGWPAIFHGPLTNWLRKFDAGVKDITGASLQTLLNYVKSGRSVVTYVTIHLATPVWQSASFGNAVSNNHAVCLDGYNQVTKQVHLSDPIDGFYWVSESKFLNAYNAVKGAVVI